MTKAASAAAKDFAAAGVCGVHLAWADNNGIPRSRIVPVAGLADAATRGVGATSLFAVFDTHDSITYQHEDLGTPSGDIRLVPLGLCRPDVRPPSRLLTGTEREQLAG
ncbi:hypothetical protein ABT262_29920, partial [Amycolatopsis mediterranei]